MTLPHQAHSATSRLAAERAEGKAAADRERILAWLIRRGAFGATDDEMQVELFGGQGNTQRPRRRELEQAGLIFATKEKRRTRTESPATVWVAIKPGQQLELVR